MCKFSRKNAYKKDSLTKNREREPWIIKKTTIKIIRIII